MKKRLMIVCDAYLPGERGGGGMWAVRNLAERFSELYEVFIVTRDCDGRIDDTPYVGIPRNKWIRRPEAMIYYASPSHINARKFAELAEEVDPDLIYLNSLLSKPCVRFLMSRRFHFNNKVPLILAPSGEVSEAAWQQTAFKKKSFLLFAKLSGLLKNIQWKAATEDERSDIRRVVGNVPIRVVPELSPIHILPDFNFHEKPEKRRGELQLVFLSRVTPHKNLDFLLSRLSEIDEGNITLDVIGPTDDPEYVERCKTTASKLPDNITVRFLGPLLREQGLEVLKNSHFMALPTKGENFGYVVIESLSAGTPVLLSDRVPWEQVEEGGAGWLTSLDDEKLWRDRMLSCLRMDSNQYRAISSTARDFAVEYLSAETPLAINRSLFDGALEDLSYDKVETIRSESNGYHGSVRVSDPARKPALWVISEIYYPEEISTGYYLTSIAEGLAENYRVNVICGQPNYASRGTRAPKRESRNGVEIFRVSSTTLDKNIIPFRILNMLTLSASVFFFALRNFKKNERALVVTAPPSLPFVTAVASLLKSSNYTLLLHDCYPEVLVAVGKLKPNSFLSKLVNHLNSWLYKHAAKIIVVGRDMNELLRRKTNGLRIPIVFIPNWADLEAVHPTPRQENSLLSDLGIEDKFVFMYAGNIGHPTDIESIIECADRLRSKEGFHFVFVGTGAKSRWLEKQVAVRGLKNVSILGQRPRKEQIIFLNACDVGLVSLVKNMWGTAMPSRTYNILAAGKPILALTEDGSELARVIEEEGVGWYTMPGDVDRLQATVLQIYESREHLPKMGERAREAAIRKYSRASAIAKYAIEFRAD
jgi:glycosyltransferase involved in cell wall biosynthesis